jgi:hypothetical protein
MTVIRSFCSSSDSAVISIQVSLLSIASDHITFYVVVVLVAMYSLFVGVFVEANVQPSDPLAPLLYDFCAGTLYLPLVSRLITVMRQSPTSTITAVSLLALVFYSSTAVFVGVYRGDQGAQKSDINYVPRHCVIERVIMAVLSLCVAFFSDMVRQLSSKFKLWISVSSLCFCVAAERHAPTVFHVLVGSVCGDSGSDAVL